MTARPIMMTGLAFTIGIVVGLLFRLPGTTGPSVHRRGIGAGETFSAQNLYNLRFPEIDQPDSIQQQQQPATADDAVFFSNTPVETQNFKQRSGITRMIPESKIIPQSLKDKVNMDYNDNGFIHSRKNPRVNTTDPAAAAVIAFPDREKGGSLFSGVASSTSEHAGNGGLQYIKSRILSVLQDIKVVQLERNNILDDIAAKQINAGLKIWGKERQSSQDAPNHRRGNVDIEFRKTPDQTSNILSQKPGEPQTPIDNKIEDALPSQRKAGIGSKGFHPIVHQTDSDPAPDHHTAKPVDIVDGGVFWTEELENLCPRGFSDQMYRSWKERIVKTNVVGIDEGCGRMQNRLLTFQDSSQACARYRPNTDQIQGEIFSYHLSKLLGINNVPPSVLVSVKNGDPRWDQVGKEVAMSQWGDDKLIVLTEWIEGLQPAYIPEEFRHETDKKLYPNDTKMLNKSLTDLCELVQWSDLIIFDYLTANLDRMVNNMFNQQWNSQMMTYPAHNLHKVKDSNILVFLDNESGLFHGYRLLDKYSKYHRELLQSLCTFRTSTAQTVDRLVLDNNLEEELHRTFVSNELHSGILPDIPEQNMHILKQRLKDVYEQIQTCQRRFHS